MDDRKRDKLQLILIIVLVFLGILLGAGVAGYNSGLVEKLVKDIKAGVAEKGTPVPASCLKIKKTPKIDPADDYNINDSFKPPAEYSRYRKYLDGKKSLDFTPSIELCNAVLYRIKKDYVEEISAEELFKGVKKEAAKVVTDAGLDVKCLDQLPLDKNLFEGVVKGYSEVIDKRLLLYACIRGLVKGAGDPYCRFLSPEQYKKFITRTREQQYTGIGVRISREPENGYIKILEVFKTGPAHASGVKKGDFIVKINDKEVAKMGLSQASQNIKGLENTKVKLTLLRGADMIDLKVPRKKIVVHSVHSKMLKKGIGYIKLDGFKEELNEEFRKSYEKLEKKGMKALILDMRNNPGGLVRSAQYLCGCFMPRNSVVAVFRHKNKGKRVVRAMGRRIVFIPVAVLVNENSASSSEIVAGALRDSGVGKIIGVRTRGKGSVQRTARLKGGAALKLTIEKIYTPNGFSIDKYGIPPDVKVAAWPGYDTGKPGNDVQLKKAIMYLKSKM